MDENKKEASAVQEQRLGDESVIEIYRRRGGYEVRVNGQPIERLRSFALRVSNEPQHGMHEAPFYQVEQYLTTPRGNKEHENIEETHHRLTMDELPVIVQKNRPPVDVLAELGAVQDTPILGTKKESLTNNDMQRQMQPT